MIVPWIAVVAGALRRTDGMWLMHRRPEGKHHAGLWEFPGGKVESTELPVEALVRELAEELGITCHASACIPSGFAETGPDEAARPLVILLYNVSAWEGEPQALEGGEGAWFTPDEVLGLPKPPLDIRRAAQLFQKH